MVSTYLWCQVRKRAKPRPWSISQCRANSFKNEKRGAEREKGIPFISAGTW